MALSGSNGTFRLSLPGSNSSSGELFIYNLEFFKATDEDPGVLLCSAACDIFWEQEVNGTSTVSLNRTSDGVVHDLGWRIVSEDPATRVGIYHWKSLPLEAVSLTSNRTVYQWAPSTGHLLENQLDQNSQPFEIHIIDWDYANGQLFQPEATIYPARSARPALSTGAKVGIAIGAAVVVLAALACFFLFRWRRRRRAALKWPQADAHEIDDPSRKSELPAANADAHEKGSNARTSITTSELPGANGHAQTEETHNNDNTTKLTGLVSSQENQAPQSFLARSDSQVSSNARTQENSLPMYSVDTPVSALVGTATRPQQEDKSSAVSQQHAAPSLAAAPTTDVNTLKAQEREIAHQKEVSEQLQQLRAEQAALQDRIRLAELRERELGHGEEKS